MKLTSVMKKRSLRHSEIPDQSLSMKNLLRSSWPMSLPRQIHLHLLSTIRFQDLAAKSRRSRVRLVSCHVLAVNSGPQPTPKPKSSGQDSRSLASRGGSRPPQVPTHIPISVQFISETPASYELARETGTNYASQLNSIRNKVAQNIYQPRQGVSSTTRTNDLAVFLRSDPPSSISTQSQSFQPTLQKEEVGAFHRMFGRKKVH